MIKRALCSGCVCLLILLAADSLSAQRASAQVCKPFASNGRLRAGQSFNVRVRGDLVVGLQAGRSVDGWSLHAGPPGRPDINYFAVTPPLQFSRFEFTIGHGYGLTPAESARVERDVRFVTNERNFRTVWDAVGYGTKPAIETESLMALQRRLMTGRLSLRIQDFVLASPGDDKAEFEWISFTGEVCVPRN